VYLVLGDDSNASLMAHIYPFKKIITWYTAGKERRSKEMKSKGRKNVRRPRVGLITVVSRGLF